MIWGIYHVPLTKRESTFLQFVDFARKLADMGDLVWLVCPLTDVFSPRALGLDESRVQVLSVPFRPVRGAPIANYSVVPPTVAESFSVAGGRYPVDVFFTACTLAVPALFNVLNDQFVDEWHTYIPVVHWESGIQDKLNRMRESTHHLYALGLATSIPVFLSEREYEVGRSLVLRYVPEAARTFEDRSLVAPTCMDMAKLERIRAAMGKRETPTVLYGARFNAVKQTGKVIRVVDTVYRSGRKLRFVLTTPTGIKPTVRRGLPKEVFENEYVEVLTHVDRETYYRIAAQAHVGISMSKFEGFPIGFWEQLALEVAVLFPRRPWVKGVVPDWYPWVYEAERNEELAAVAVLGEMLDDLERTREKTRFPELWEWAKARLSAMSVVEKMRAHVGNLLERAEVRSFGDADKLFGEVLEELGSEFRFTQFIARAAERGRAFPADPWKRALSRIMPSNYDILHFLRSRGYEAVRFEGRDYVMREVTG